MKVGLVCPYSVDFPGGVQSHVLDLAKYLRDIGHHASVLIPGKSLTDLPEYVVATGKSIPIPYNGSVARLSFSPGAHKKVKEWLKEGQFDVIHVHEPNAPSVSLLAMMQSDVPIVATFHTSTTASLWLKTFQGVLRPYNEKICGKIVVSELARQWQMNALNSDALEIPNGVNCDFFTHAQPLEGYPRTQITIGFLGRYDEPRKGIDVLIEAAKKVVEHYPQVQFLIIGGGDEARIRTKLGELADNFVFLGSVSDADKARALRSMDIYCAPQLFGESFGIVLVEAMAAGTPVVASDLPAFKKVLADGAFGKLFSKGNGEQLADTLCELIADKATRKSMSDKGLLAARQYDWEVVANNILKVYEAVSIQRHDEQEKMHVDELLPHKNHKIFTRKTRNTTLPLTPIFHPFTSSLSKNGQVAMEFNPVTPSKPRKKIAKLLGKQSARNNVDPSPIAEDNSSYPSLSSD